MKNNVKVFMFTVTAVSCLFSTAVLSHAASRQAIPSEAEADLMYQREILEYRDAICGVIFLGGIGEFSGKLSEDSEYLNSFLENSEYVNEYSFIKEIPPERIVETENGYELYCIYPADPNASVAVNEYVINESNGYWGETGDILYKSEFGEPILLRCNVSDIMQDSQLNIVDSQGNVLVWEPCLSLYDGSVRIPVTAPYVFDGSYLTGPLGYSEDGSTWRSRQE